MNLVPNNYFRVALIARAACVGKKRIHRQAARERWPRKRCANAFVFQPPRELLGKCRKLAAATVAFPERLSQPLLFESLRVAFRWVGCLLLAQAIQVREPRELALRHIAEQMDFKISPTSLRRNFLRFAALGVTGLAERKRGRVGRKKNIR